MAHSELGARLRAARLARSWTLEDVAVALHQLNAELGEPESGVDLTHVWKWENGVRSPSRYYQARLCVVFEAMPAEVGLVGTPRLMRDIGELRRRLHERADDIARGPLPDVEHDRLAAVVKHFWPVDWALVDGLTRAGHHLAARTDTGPAGEVLPDLHAYLNTLHELLARSQPADLTARLKVLASAAAQHASFLSDSIERGRDAYTLSAEAELLAREADDHNRLAEVLVDRAEQHSRRTHGLHGLNVSIALAEAALMTMDEDASAGLRGWAHGQAAADLAAQGDDLASGRHLDRAYEATAGADNLNLFSDYASAWLESYRGLRAIRLGHDREAARVFEAVLSGTDPRLLWERTRALYRLAWALAHQDEVERAVDLLREAVHVTAANGDRRGLAAAVRVRDQHLGRWRTDHRLRELDEVIRAAR